MKCFDMLEITLSQVIFNYSSFFNLVYICSAFSNLNQFKSTKQKKFSNKNLRAKWEKKKNIVF